jgi:hypothetical protein
MLHGVHTLVTFVLPITAMQTPTVTLNHLVPLTNDTAVDGAQLLAGSTMFQVKEIEVFEITD